MSEKSSTVAGWFVENLEETVLNSELENRMKHRKLSHAYLVTGEDRLALARRLAAAFVCTGENPPCGLCSGCRKAELGIHPDIFLADQEGNGLKAEQIRALRADAYIRPNEASRKVYLFAHGELLNPTCQNILLKLIEEGPAYGAFLLLSPNSEGLLPTIRSRCETLRALGGTMETKGSEEAATLTALIARDAPPEERLPLLISLEKRSREEIAALLDQVLADLTERARTRPALLEPIARLEPIRAACAFNISAGHLSGWLMAVL